MDERSVHRPDDPIEVFVPVSGDPFIAAVLADLLPSEREMWLRLYEAPAYRAELRKLAEWGVEPPEEDEDD